MTDKRTAKTVPARFHCYPEHDLDVHLFCEEGAVEESADSYCWTIRQGEVPEHLVGKVTGEGQGACPVCGNVVDFTTRGTSDGQE